jgi:A/G-specific adenine glycosylase
MAVNRFSELLLDWFQQNKRALPWRNTKDPYKIWLSEVMLQQTRVSQGLPYYERFVHHYPTIKKLANAPEKEIFRLWQGLGYYSRARNLHRCAKIISERGGKFPETTEELKKLPGIGDYTAAAIASFAFNQPSAVVDGNVFRVLSRIFAIDLDIASPAGKKHFFGLANTLIDKENPGEFNQALHAPQSKMQGMRVFEALQGFSG